MGLTSILALLSILVFISYFGVSISTKISDFLKKRQQDSILKEYYKNMPSYKYGDIFSTVDFVPYTKGGHLIPRKKYFFYIKYFEGYHYLKEITNNSKISISIERWISSSNIDGVNKCFNELEFNEENIIRVEYLTERYDKQGKFIYVNNHFTIEWDDNIKQKVIKQSNDIDYIKTYDQVMEKTVQTI